MKKYLKYLPYFFIVTILIVALRIYYVSAAGTTFTALSLQSGSMSLFNSNNETTTPCQTGCGSISSAGITSGNYGFKFTPLKSGLISQVCINEGNTANYTVEFYTGAGAFISATTFAGVTNAWTCSNESIGVAARSSYVISVLKSSGGSYNKAANLTPFTVGDIMVTSGQATTSTLQFPTVATTTINGLPDIVFTASTTVSAAITN